MSVNQWPNDVEAERAALAGLILHGGRVAEIPEIVPAEGYYAPAHQAIATAAYKLLASGTAPDPTALADALGGLLEDVGGRHYLLLLQSDAVPPSTAVNAARIVADKARRRNVVAAAFEMIDIAAEAETADEVVRDAWAALGAATDAHAEQSAPVGIAEAVRRTRKALASEHRAIRTGLTAWDAITGGLPVGEVTVLGARPAMGKSALCAQVAVHAAMAGHPVLFCSLEMSVERVVDRMVAQLAGVPVETLGQDAAWDSQKVARAVADLELADLSIDDSTALSSEVLATKLRRFCAGRAAGPPPLVVLDYLQLLDAPKVRARDSRNDQVGHDSRQLKLLAGDLGVTILAAAQLNRGLENRADKRPVMSDLRESGEIEQHAAQVVMLYRDEVYDDQSRDAGVAEVIVRKNRFGRIGTARLAFLANRTAFHQMAQG